MHHWRSFLLELVQEENFDQNDCVDTCEVFPVWENTTVEEVVSFFNVEFSFTLIEMFAWALNGLKMFMFPAGHNV